VHHSRSFDRGTWKQNEEYTEKEEWSAAAVENKEFILNNTNGMIAVEGSTHKERIHVTAWKTVRAATKEEAKSRMADISIDIQEREQSCRVTTRHPHGEHGLGYTVNYTVELPDAWSVKIENKNGDIQISNLKNTLNLNLINGTIRTTDVAADVHAKVINGNMHVRQILPINGSCILNAVNGSINLLLNKEASAVIRAGGNNGTVFGENLYSYSKKTHGEFQRVLRDGKGTVNLMVENGSIGIGYF
jgi:DUF4097 and DUF4098 domain-containing protein YvlB